MGGGNGKSMRGMIIYLFGTRENKQFHLSCHKNCMAQMGVTHPSTLWNRVMQFLRVLLDDRFYRVSQKTVPSLCGGCCGGALAFIVLVLPQLHRSSFSLDFETLFKSI